MTIEMAIKMIDEYLLEPNNIDKDWVEVLYLCKDALLRDVSNDVHHQCKCKGRCDKKDG